MGNKVYYDEDADILHQEFIGETTEGDLEEIYNNSLKLLEGKKRRYVLCDMSQSSAVRFQSTSSSRFDRKQMIEGSVRLGYEKLAYVGVPAISRVIVKMVIAGVRKEIPHLESGFFKTRAETLAWIKGE